MRRAAKAFAGARGSAEASDLPFEVLEPRLALSAPTATPQAPTIGGGYLAFPVMYHTDNPLDLSTIDANDVVVTGPAGFAQWAQPSPSMTTRYNNGDVWVLYTVLAPGNQGWNWPDANGTYNVGLAPDAVRNTAGEGNAAAGMGSYWLWFTPQFSIGWQTNLMGLGPRTPTGWPVWGSFQSSNDAWFFDVDQWTGYRTYAPGLAMRVTGPNGYDQTTALTHQQPYRQLELASYGNSVGGVVTAPGGTWDSTDNGVYNVQVAYLAPGSTLTDPRMGRMLLEQTFTQNIGGPRAEVVSSAFGPHDWFVTVRYTPAPGAAINTASISNGDIEGYFADAAMQEIAATLVQPPTTNSDGSVTALYRIASPNSGGWTGAYAAGGLLWTRRDEITDNAGRSVGVGPVGAGNASFDRPSIVGLRTLGAVVNAWDLELTFRNPSGLASTLTLGNGNLSVYADINGVYQLAPVNMTLVSSSTGADNTLAVHYRVTPRQGFLWDGTYTLQLNPQATFGVDWGLGLTQAFVMHFAGPSVQGLRTLSRTNTSWDVELAWNNPGSLISTASLSAQNLIVAAPGGRAMRISLVSFANSDGVLRVRYRVTSINAGMALPHGTYRFSLRGGSVFAAGIGLPGQFLADFTI